MVDQKVVCPLYQSNGSEVKNVKTQFYYFANDQLYLPQNFIKAYQGEAQDGLAIVLKLMDDVNCFLKNATKKNTLSEEILAKEVKGFQAIEINTQQLQKCQLANYTPEQKKAFFLNIYQLMKFHW